MQRRDGRELLGRLRHRFGGTGASTTGAGAGRRSLESRVAELEAEMQESRRLTMRVAELTDIIQELLLPVGQRDEAALSGRLERYSSSL